MIIQDLAGVSAFFLSSKAIAAYKFLLPFSNLMDLVSPHTESTHLHSKPDIPDFPYCVYYMCNSHVSPYHVWIQNFQSCNIGKQRWENSRVYFRASWPRILIPHSVASSMKRLFLLSSLHHCLIKHRLHAGVSDVAPKSNGWKSIILYLNLTLFLRLSPWGELEHTQLYIAAFKYKSKLQTQMQMVNEKFQNCPLLITRW